ncbi:M1 family metallopeptidase [Kallotenue papyrolyticum]|uniref:M1 family metallopeptidase n=1 Tax=Kallotenue papyrolyticum TaxID=1325125 RepID=UPI0004928950|nr:M1 family metallopeptidase [Kallotenue papyrolyticum]
MRLRMVVLLCLLAGLLLPPSTHAEPPPPPPDFSPALRPAFAADAERGDLPRYTLDLTIEPQARRMSGQLRLQMRNTTGVELRDVVLRLYPHFPPDIFGDGGTARMDLSDISVQGMPTAARYEAQRTAVRLPLPQPAAPGATIELALRYRSTLEVWSERDGTLALPAFYPLLAVWQDGWRTDVTRFPDQVFAASALYAATISVPAGYSVVSSGQTVSSATRAGRTVFEIVSGPVRQFAIGVGRFAVARAAHNGIEVNVWHRPGLGLEAAAQRIALHAAASLASLEARFGPYPYRELDIHLISARRGFDIGAEFPGLIVILLNRGYTDETRYIVAHEVAHQWFYGLVGNDVYNEPWLDEAFAQYGGVLVEEDWGGPAAAERVYERQVARLAARTSLPAGLSITRYRTWNTYYAAVYGRGAQFLHTLRGELGDAAFFDGLRAYVATQRYAIASSADVERALAQRSGRDLRELFRQWLGR